MKIARLFVIFAIASSAVLFTTGCNTTAGIGRDLQILGEKMERKAEDKYYD